MIKYLKNLFSKKKKNIKFTIPIVKPLDEYNPEIRKLVSLSSMEDFTRSLKFDNDGDIDLLNFSLLSKEAKIKIKDIYIEELKKLGKV
jgi:hypothetical protein